MEIRPFLLRELKSCVYFAFRLSPFLKMLKNLFNDLEYKYLSVLL